MNIHIRGEHMLITEALRDYASKKIGKLERYFERPLDTDVHITLSVIRELHTVEVTIPIPGLVLRAEERSEDMYASIDLVMEKLEQQIRKHKTKVSKKIRHGAGQKAVFKEAVVAPIAVAEEDADDDDLYDVVKTKRFQLKPMDVEEAILQMNLVGHNFYVFSNADTREVNVVYKRNDGRYGLIEPGKD